MSQYRSFWEARDRAWPGWPRHGVWVVERDANGADTLLMGCAVLLTQDAPFALVEAFATNPAVSLRKRHRATECGLKALLELAAMMDRNLVLTPSRKSKGVIGMARKLGYRVGDALPLFGGLGK
jgi:hypothetical protein